MPKANDTADKAGINLNPLQGLETAAAQMLITDLQGIQKDVDGITTAAQANNFVAVQGYIADITGKLVALQIQLPMLLPVAQGALVATASTNVSSLLSDIISKLQGLVPASSASGGSTPAKA